MSKPTDRHGLGGRNPTSEVFGRTEDVPIPGLDAAETAQITRLLAGVSLPAGRHADQVRGDTLFEVKSLFVRCVFRRGEESPPAGPADDAAAEESPFVDDSPDDFAGGLFER